MILTAGKLIEGRDPLVCVTIEDPVSKAAKLMHTHDYSQLPVVDARRHVVGLFTEQALTKMLAMGAMHEFLDESVERWMRRHPIVVGTDRSVYDVASLLVNTYAVVVARNAQPVGIITDFDIAEFMADWSKGIALVEDIEERLRGYIERVYSTPKALDDALRRAVGEVDGKPRKEYTELTLNEHILLIVTKSNWPAFAPYFKSETAFRSVLEDVRPIRNQIVHFRGKLTDLQIKTLKEAQEWLQGRPRVQTKSRKPSDEITAGPHLEGAPL